MLLDNIPYRLVRTSTGEESFGTTNEQGETEISGTEQSSDKLEVFYAGDKEISYVWE